MKRYVTAFIITLILHLILLLGTPDFNIIKKLSDVPLMDVRIIPEELPVEKPAEIKSVPRPKPSPEPVTEKTEEPLKSDQVEESPEPDARDIVPSTEHYDTRPETSSKGPVNQDELDNPNVQRFGNVRPEYPAIARKSGIEGYVHVRCLVDRKGKVVRTEVVDVKGHDSFKTATLNAAVKWRFPPLTSKGKRVMAWVNQKVYFQLKD